MLGAALAGEPPANTSYLPHRRLDGINKNMEFPKALKNKMPRISFRGILFFKGLWEFHTLIYPFKMAIPKEPF